MAPIRLTTLALRYSILAVFAICVGFPRVQAQSAAVGVTGVYDGTYTCAMGPRTLKLSLVASGHGSMTGLFTFYLPPNSHTKAYSYSLNGTFDEGSGKFKLTPVKWDVAPPESYSMVGMEGSFNPATKQIAGKITYGSCRGFEATRDEDESAKMAAVTPQKTPIPTRLASQNALPPAAPSVASRSAAAVQNHAPTSKPVEGSSAPSPNSTVVQEPQSYWGDYQSTVIEDVFEGNFSRDMDSSIEFRVLFNSYVEAFSKSCHASLPPRYESITLSQDIEKRDRYGNVTSQQTKQSWTVDVDPRFAPSYRQYANALMTKSGQSLAGALAIASGRVSAGSYFAPGTDISTFFEHESCQSAAMHQLTENLYRATMGRPSVQKSGDPNVVRVCVPSELIQEWRNPQPGSKMDKFKVHFKNALRVHFADPSSDPTQWWWIDDRVYPTYDPATPLGDVVFSYNPGTCSLGMVVDSLSIAP